MTRANSVIKGKREVSGLFESRSLINGTANIIERPNHIKVTKRCTESPFERSAAWLPSAIPERMSSRDFPSARNEVVIAVSALITDAINDMFFSIELWAFFVLIIL